MPPLTLDFGLKLIILELRCRHKLLVILLLKIPWCSSWDHLVVVAMQLIGPLLVLLGVMVCSLSSVFSGEVGRQLLVYDIPIDLFSYQRLVFSLEIVKELLIQW